MEFNHIIKLSAEELYQKALEFKKVKDYDNYAMHITMSANHNYKLAQDILAHPNDNDFSKQNHSITKHFYKATKDYSQSTYYLGFIYECGYGVKQSNKKARKLYEMAVEKDNGDAMNNLGIMYDVGIGIDKDYDKAIELYNKAIAKGNNCAIFNLAIVYETVESIRDYNKARELYEMGVIKDDVDCLNNLIILYKNTNFKTNKQNVIDYFLKINKLDRLKEIYNYDDYVIQLITDNNKLTKNTTSLKRKIDELETHIMASPDGELYFEAKNNWNANVK